MSCVWNFLKKVDKSMAHCNLCKKKYKHGGNTTNLRQHLSRMHPIFYTSDVSINREKPQTGSESSNDIDDNNDVDDSNEVNDTSYSDASSSIVNNKRRKLQSNCKVRYQNIIFIKIYIQNIYIIRNNICHYKCINYRNPIVMYELIQHFRERVLLQVSKNSTHTNKFR